MRQRRLFPALLILLAAFAPPARGQETTPSPSTTPSESASTGEEEVSGMPKSPDGKFGFITDYDSEFPTIDLIDAATKKVLQRVVEEDYGNARFGVLWSADSSRFALMTRRGHPNLGIDVFFRVGKKFRKIELPKLPTADIPVKMKHGKSFPHVANNNWQQADSWNKDGSLDLSITTSIDGGDGGTITATRYLKLTFDKSGNAKITKNTIKYETENSDE